MTKLSRLFWSLPALAFLGVTTWAFAALNQPAPMADWPEPATEPRVVEAPAAPVAPRAPPRRSLLARARPPEVEPNAPVDLAELIPFQPHEPAGIVEVGALWRAPIGRAFEACLARRPSRDRFEMTTMFSALDRVAFGGDLLVMEGDLADPAVLRVLFDEREPTPYRDAAIYERRGARLSDRRAVLSKGHRTDLRRLVDRAGEPAGSTLLPPAERYGEASIALPPALVARMLDDLVDVAPDEALTIERATLHVDAVDDVLVTLELDGADPHALAGLRDSLGLAAAALRAGRGLHSSRWPRFDDVQVALTDTRLTVTVQMTPEEAVRLVPECRR